MLTACLLAAALAAGVTGAWSPCGLSMVDTLAPAGYARTLRTSLLACATFALGALAGGALTFGGLARTRRRARRGNARGARRRGGRRGRRGGGGGARPADRPADPPPGAGGVAPHPARPARRGRLRRPARARLHHVRPLLRRLGARGDQRRGRGSRPRPGDGPGVRRGARAPRRRPRARGRHPPRRRSHRGDAASGRRSCSACDGSTRSRSPPSRSRWAPPRHEAVAARPARLRAVRGQRVRPQRGGRPRRLAAPGQPRAAPARRDDHAARLAPRPGWRPDRLARGGRARDRRPRHAAARGAGRRPRRRRARRQRPLVAWRTRDESGTDRLHADLGGGGAVLFESPAPREIGRPALAGTTILCHTAGPHGSRVLRSTPRPAPSRSSAATRSRRSPTRRPTVRACSTSTRAAGPNSCASARSPRATRTPTRVILVHPAPGRRDREHEPGRRLHRQGYAGHRHPPLPPRATPGVVATLWSTALAPGTAYVTRMHGGQGAAADRGHPPRPGTGVTAGRAG